MVSLATASSPITNHSQPPYRGRGMWSTAEHRRFLEALERYPCGPWRAISSHVATRSIRQVKAHARKYQEALQKSLRDGDIPKFDTEELHLRPSIIDTDGIVNLSPSKAAPSDTCLLSPKSVTHFDFELESVILEAVQSPSLSFVIMDETMGLPSLDESLDFFIEQFSF